MAIIRTNTAVLSRATSTKKLRHSDLARSVELPESRHSTVTARSRQPFEPREVIRVQRDQQQPGRRSATGAHPPHRPSRLAGPTGRPPGQRLGCCATFHELRSAGRIQQATPRSGRTPADPCLRSARPPCVLDPCCHKRQNAVCGMRSASAERCPQPPVFRRVFDVSACTQPSLIVRTALSPDSPSPTYPQVNDHFRIRRQGPGRAGASKSGGLRRPLPFGHVSSAVTWGLLVAGVGFEPT